jgi:hypothetical protein
MLRLFVLLLLIALGEGELVSVAGPSSHARHFYYLPCSILNSFDG